MGKPRKLFAWAVVCTAGMSLCGTGLYLVGQAQRRHVEEATLPLVAPFVMVTYYEAGELVGITFDRDEMVQSLDVPIVDELSFRQAPRLTDSEVAIVARLSYLRCLNLATTDVSDLGISYLGKLKRLRSLDITRTRVTKQGLVALTQLPELEFLRIDQELITEQSIATIKQVPCLRVLCIECRRSRAVSVDKVQHKLMPCEVIVEGRPGRSAHTALWDRIK